MATDQITIPNEGQQAAQDHPEELDSQEQLFGENNVDLPEQLVGILRGLFRKFMKEEMYERRWEVMTGRRLRFYERGFQHISWSARDYCFQQVTPGMTTTVGSDTLEAPNYIDDYNIFQPYLLTKVAVLTQNPPGVDFLPKKAGDSVDSQAAHDAEGYRALFDQANDVAQKQAQIARYQGLSSRVVAWTRTEADAQRWGMGPDGKPAQRETTDIYGDLETKCRITARCLSDTNYFVISIEKNILDAKKENPDFRNEIKASETGLGEESYERIARLGVLQGQKTALAIGDLLKNLVTEHHCWLRPSAFEDESCDAVPQFEFKGDDVENVRDVLNQIFKDGVHGKFVGETYCGSWNETMDDHLTVCFAYEQDGMSRMAFMYPALTLQDRFNDFMNAASEVFDYGWPSKWIEGDEADGDAIRDQRSEPWNIYTKKLPNNVNSLGDLFYQEPYPELPDTFNGHVQFISGQLAQFILGAPPALFGGAMKNTDTAHAYAQARDQAMGNVGPTWAQMQSMWAGIYYQACLAAGQNPDYSEEMVVPGKKGQNVNVRLTRLQKGRFGCYPDKDSSFPETTAAKRQMLQAFLALIGQNPVAMQAFLALPSNWELVKDISGIPQAQFLQSIAEEVELRAIDQLTKESPIKPKPEVLQAAQQAHAQLTLQARAAGQPDPPPFNPMDLMQPSVPADPDFGYHQFAYAFDQQWLNGDEPVKLLAEGNRDAVLNVRLRALQNKKLAEADAAQQAAMMPPIGQSANKPAVPPGQGTPQAPGTTQATLQ